MSLSGEESVSMVSVLFFLNVLMSNIILQSGHLFSTTVEASWSAYEAPRNHFWQHSAWKMCLHIGIRTILSVSLKFSKHITHSFCSYSSVSFVS